MTKRSTIRLVRHGKAAAGWGTDADPDLDGVGRAQADRVAQVLQSFGPMAAVSSPLLRCRSTAAAYADLVGVEVAVANAVAEIPSPVGLSLDERAVWLRSVLPGSWADLGSPFVDYRDSVVSFVRGCDDATVIFSHFVAINAVIGACLGDDRLVGRRLDNCSVTTVEVVDGRLTLIEAGREADTEVR